MPILTVESVVLTKSGKAYNVKAGGKFYVASKSSGIEQVMPGTQIDATLGAFAAPNGANVSTIDGFTKLNGNIALQARQEPSGGVQVVDRFYMAFVSNVVAHAIQVGRILEPEDILDWATAARDAAMALEEKEAPKDKIDDVEDDIPF